ncbi:MAG TPA: T9SS type A sorting domain-containing protein, partial [Saprospiraceae bacterium]|nr:T9SS type A sorting domain-containing protein [Saprospiraceae bacterium]
NWQTLGYDLNSFSCDPVFDDLSSLRLSPLDDCARNSGTPLNSFKYDIDDQERGNEDGWDIGADEYYETVIASLLSNVDAAKALISEETALFPNPGQEGFFIKLPDENSAVKVVVRDAQGRMVKSFESEAGRMIFKVEMADQPDGIYFIQIGRAGRPFENLKWLKNR